MSTLDFDQILSRFKHPVSRPSKEWWILLIAMLLLVGFGLVGLYQQIKYGHIVTGMRDHVVWGVFIVNFIFFLGIGYAGIILAGIFHLTRIKWTKPLHRLAEIFGLVGLCIGPIFIFLCIGRLDRVLYIFKYARIQSPITWDVMAIMTNLILIATYLYVAHIREFAKLRDTKVLDLPDWKRKLYRRLALGFERRPEQRKYLNRAQNILAATMIPAALLADSLLAWLFGMSLRPGWHSTLFAPEFVLVAIYSGVAMLILMMWIYRSQYKLEDIITKTHFRYAGYLLLMLCLAFAYFTFSEYITEWYNVTKTHGHWLDSILDPARFGLMSLLTISLAIVIPIIVLIIPQIRNPKSISLVALLVLVGLWFKRYLIIVPTLETPHLPIQDIRPEYVHYQATWVEWSLSLGGLALGVILIMLLNYLAPAIPVADMERDDEIIVPKPFYQTP